jgi:2-(1,2-epoxy-1,2-dihydrophenyl)acetyl-CoA isomerase
VTYSRLRCEIDDRIATITLAHAKKLNALDGILLLELRQALESVALSDARALIITGEGRAFSSGGDVLGDPSEIPADLGAALEELHHPMLNALIDLRIPVVCGLNGFAVGGACALPLLSDFVVASTAASFQFAFAKIGLVPDCGVGWLLVNRVGAARATELLMLGQALSAEQAMAMGLVYRVVDPALLHLEVTALARHLAEGPTQALGLTRRALHLASAQTFAEALGQERQDQRVAGSTNDFAEGLAALRARRSAQFTGR